MVRSRGLVHLLGAEVISDESRRKIFPRYGSRERQLNYTQLVVSQDEIGEENLVTTTFTGIALD